jgi:hypothetical protein
MGLRRRRYTRFGSTVLRARLKEGRPVPRDLAHALPLDEHAGLTAPSSTALADGVPIDDDVLITVEADTEPGNLLPTLATLLLKLALSEQKGSP